MAHVMQMLEPRRVRGVGFDHDHEVRVALPASYSAEDARTYPSLWVTDGSLGFDLAVGVLNVLTMMGEAPEMVVIGVGCPTDESPMEFNRRRSFDLSIHPDEYLYQGSGSDFLRQVIPSALFETVGGADALLSLLVDRLRPELSAQLKLDPSDHALTGVSQGGLFATYAALVRPGAFAKHIIGSPALNGGERRIFEIEASYALANGDLPTQIFFGAGEREIEDFYISAWNVVGSMLELHQRLLMRQYPSLQMSVRIFPGETHASSVPSILSWGIRALWPAPSAVAFEDLAAALIEAQ